MVSNSGILRLRFNTVRLTFITSTKPAPLITTSWIGRQYLSLLDGLKLGCRPKKHARLLSASMRSITFHQVGGMITQLMATIVLFIRSEPWSPTQRHEPFT